MPLPDGRPSLYDLNPSHYSNTRAAADKVNQANDRLLASGSQADRRAAALRNSEDSRRAGLRAALANHHADVPGKGGGHGGNPNHDEQGRFT